MGAPHVWCTLILPLKRLHRRHVPKGRTLYAVDRQTCVELDGLGQWEHRKPLFILNPTEHTTFSFRHDTMLGH